jgi:hypothetical protein
MQEAAHALSARVRDADHISLARVIIFWSKAAEALSTDARQEA